MGPEYPILLSTNCFALFSGSMRRESAKRGAQGWAWPSRSVRFDSMAAKSVLPIHREEGSRSGSLFPPQVLLRGEFKFLKSNSEHLL
jgi:hypothetical protein